MVGPHDDAAQAGAGVAALADLREAFGGVGQMCLRRRGISGGVHADIRHAAGACAGFCRCTAACLRELSLPGDVPGTGYPLGADGIPDLAGIGAGALGRRRRIWNAVVFRRGGEYPWCAQSGDVRDRDGALVLFRRRGRARFPECGAGALAFQSAALVLAAAVSLGLVLAVYSRWTRGEEGR